MRESSMHLERTPLIPRFLVIVTLLFWTGVLVFMIEDGQSDTSCGGG